MNDPINPYAAPQVDTTFAPGAEWIRSASPSLRKTALGLNLIYWGIVITLLAVIAAIPISLMAGVRVNRGWMMPGLGGGEGPVVFLLMACGILMLLGRILTFIGPFFCLTVPTETGARIWIVLSVFFQLCSVAGSVIGWITPSALPKPLVMVLELCSFISVIFFILFMKKLSSFIDRYDLVRRAVHVLTGLVIVLILGVASFLGVFLDPLFGLLFVAVLIGALIVFLMYVNLIDALVKALRGNS